jgi:hypothetical protein
MAEGPSPETWTGLTWMADTSRDFLGAWEGFRVEASEYGELGDGPRARAGPHQLAGEGKRNGAWADADEERQSHIRDGRVALRVRIGASSKIARAHCSLVRP